MLAGPERCSYIARFAGWSLRLSVRTSGFQPEKRGSTPLGTASGRFIELNLLIFSRNIRFGPIRGPDGPLRLPGATSSNVSVNHFNKRPVVAIGRDLVTPPWPHSGPALLSTIGHFRAIGRDFNFRPCPFEFMQVEREPS